MTILHVVASVHRQGGGTSEVVPRLARAQRGLGHRVILAVAHLGEVSDAASAAFGAGVEYKAFPRLRFLSALGFSPALRKGLKSLVAEADVVHIHGLWQAPIWYAACEALRQGKPYVMMPHGFLEPARLKISAWKKRIIGWLGQTRLLKKAVAIVTTAESETQGVREFGLKNRVHVMPIGIDLERFGEAMSKASSKEGKKTLLYLSRITPIKGLDLLAEAWARVRPEGWKLLIVGPDDRGYTDEIKKIFAAKCAAESYEFRGPVYGDEKYDLLDSADAFVLPTRSENWSIAVAEAMASGLPVICTKGAPWECLETTGAGWWCEISVSGIEAAIRAMMNLTDEERRAKGAKGRKWVEENLSWSEIASKMIRFYEEVY